jgi:hypothetical protein
MCLPPPYSHTLPSRSLDHFLPLQSVAAGDGDVSVLGSSRRAPSFAATDGCSKDRIPSKPHRPIMALSYIIISNGSESRQRRVTNLVPWRAWSRKHLLASEDRISSSHEAHGLLVLAQRLPTRSETNDGSRKHDTGGSDCAQECLMIDGLEIDRIRFNCTTIKP